MKTLLFTSIMIIGLAGATVVKAADFAISAPSSRAVPKLVADHPTPDPGSKKVPSLLS